MSILDAGVAASAPNPESQVQSSLNGPDAQPTKNVAFASQEDAFRERPREPRSNEPSKPVKEKTIAKKKYLKRKLGRKKAAKKAKALGSSAPEERNETPEERAERKKALKAARRAEAQGTEVSQPETSTESALEPPTNATPELKAEETPIPQEKQKKKRKKSPAPKDPPSETEECDTKTLKTLEKAAKAMRKSQKRKRTQDPDADLQEPSNAIELQALPRFAKPSKPAGPDASLLATLNVAEELRTGSRIPSTLSIQLDQLNDKGRPLLSHRTLERLKSQGITELFAVQSAVIPLLLGDKANSRRRSNMAQRDLCVNAPTGSGKTLSYVLPMVELLAKRPIRRLRALVVLPTKDLALQIKETFDLFVRGTDIKVALLTGNKKLDADRQAFDGPDGTSQVDILIATPGRLMDQVLDAKLPLQHLEFLVVDEADRLLNQDFNDWLPVLVDALKDVEEGRRLKAIAQNAPSLQSHVLTQKLLFSATLSRDPAKIASLRLTKPLYVAVTDDSTSIADHEAAEFALPATLKEAYAVISSSIKPLVLAHISHKQGLASALCFTKSTEAAKRLVSLLSLIHQEIPELAHALKTSVYSSDMPLTDRSRILQQFKTGELNLLVCSDLISRGIDIPHVQHVFNYDVPVDIRKYVHRVGRTARAGQQGSAWSLVEEQEASFFKNLMRQAQRLPKLERLRVKDKELEALMPGYERALNRLKDDYGNKATWNAE